MSTTSNEPDHGQGRSGRRASAPEVLLSVLGEYVAPGTGGAWQETLVSAIELFGHSTAAARQATARAVRDGALIARRIGRRSWLQLDDGAVRMLRGATVMTAGQASLPTGLWDVFIIHGSTGADVPSKFHPRTQMLLGGLGRLGQEIWIAPSHAGSTMVQRALQEEPGLSVVMLRSEITHPEARDVVERAWDLDEVRARYLDLIEDFGDRAAATDADVFVAWTDLQRRWRDCVRRDPGLPIDTLPEGWPRPTAEQLIARRRLEWSTRAATSFAALSASLPAPPTSDM